MITFYKKDNVSTNSTKEIEIRGLSTDEKPTAITIDGEEYPLANGTVFVEIDTGKLYMYDLENEQWKEM